ncbi:hypothetical protein P12x_000440 [Tundrisphaera lichenicola]|uniref:hypothetical protein n=1 Tax=Tundrisphaera lichenicola TaxID=2029860 RepID=UPI003EBEE6B1
MRISHINLIRWARAISAGSLILLGLSGCGEDDGLNRQAVSGTVTLDGKPLETGTIRLLPTSAEATTETSTFIEMGSYSFSKADGPVPGSYKVVISSAKRGAFDLPQGKTPGEAHPPKAKEEVPKQYNVKTTLTATVKADQAEPIDFPLVSKGG